MTDPVRPARRRPRVLLATSTAVLALAATLTPAAAAVGPDPNPAAEEATAVHRTVQVMTRNLYLGAELGPVIAALVTNPAGVPAAATATWESVQATRPEERMAAITDEIAAARPAVVGLQEVTRWTTYDSYPITATTGATVAYDFLDLLLKALADRGVVYHEVAGATAENFASPPIPVLPSTGVAAVSMADRDVILRRDDVRTWNAHSGNFENILALPLAGTTSALPVDRGWGSVDVRSRLATFRFVNAHLEAFGFGGLDAETLRYLQVGELLAAQAEIAEEHGDLPTVYVGDYNSRAPSAPAYLRLVNAVGFDAWVQANPGDSGLTCCFDPAVTDETATLESRIDLVVVDAEVTALSATVVGEEPADMTASGLWPSDHAGVLATLRVDLDPGRHRGRP